MKTFIPNIDPYYQTLIVVWGNLILFTSYLIYDFSLTSIVIAIFGLFLFGAFSEISIHRYFTHRTFQTDRFREHVLKVFALLAGQGAILSWVTVHRYHHAFEDTEKDPHSPLYHPWWKIYLGLFPKDYRKNLITDLLKSKDKDYYIFENKYYCYMWIAIWVLSFLISMDLFYLIVSGAAMWYIATSTVNVFSHSLLLGEKSYEDSVATNSVILNLLTGIGHHNNHHRQPENYSYSHAGEIDIYGWIIEKVFMKPT